MPNCTNCEGIKTWYFESPTKNKTHMYGKCSFYKKFGKDETFIIYRQHDNCFINKNKLEGYIQDCPGFEEKVDKTDDKDNKKVSKRKS
jgi:hypothetical protein